MGRLPSPAPGFPIGTLRWRWADVDAKLAGRVVVEMGTERIIAAAGRLK